MEKPKKYRIGKLYYGNAEVRDYVVDELIKQNRSIQIILHDEVMTLSPQSLKDKVVRKSEVQPSKFSKDYRLYAYKWNPDQIDL